MSHLVIEQCGPGTTLQDIGREGWRRFGISTAGAMDRLSLAVANVLVGNPAGTAAIELTLAGGRLRAEGGSVLIAAAGPGVTLSVAGREIPEGQSVVLEDGAVAQVSPVRGGVYGYVAVAGGFDLEAEMGSLSAHVRSGVGGALLQPGARLAFAGGGAERPLAIRPLPVPEQGPIRVMAGPQQDWFTEGAMARLTATEWTVSQRSDRMGRFLEGAEVAPNEGSMVSDGVLPGSIQVPPAGQPIILMRDCQTTGGYPKPATVISADLDRLAQIPAGARLRLVQVDREEALAARAAAERVLSGLVAEPVAMTPDTSLLLRENLISGVWYPGED